MIDRLIDWLIDWCRRVAKLDETFNCLLTVQSYSISLRQLKAVNLIRPWNVQDSVKSPSGEVILRVCARTTRLLCIRRTRRSLTRTNDAFVPVVPGLAALGASARGRSLHSIYCCSQIARLSSLSDVFALRHPLVIPSLRRKRAVVSPRTLLLTSIAACMIYSRTPDWFLLDYVNETTWSTPAQYIFLWNSNGIASVTRMLPYAPYVSIVTNNKMIVTRWS